MSTSCSRHQFAGDGPIVLGRRRQSTSCSHVSIGSSSGHAVQPAAQADEAELGVRRERSNQLGHEPAGAEEHVVLPGHHQRCRAPARFRAFVHRELVRVLLVESSASGAGPRASAATSSRYDARCASPHPSSTTTARRRRRRARRQPSTHVARTSTLLNVGMTTEIAGGLTHDCRAYACRFKVTGRLDAAWQDACRPVHPRRIVRDAAPRQPAAGGQFRRAGE